MPRFTLKSIFLVTALLMTFVATLAQAPLIFLVFLVVPSILSVIVMLPFLTIRLSTLLADPRERTAESEELRNTLWAFVICLFTLAPLLALILMIHSL